MAMMRKVDICGIDTSKLPLLKNEQMRELFYKLQNEHSHAAREELIYSNLRLVLSVLQRFSNRGEDADDLFQVGVIGLMKAIDNFDLSQNVRFSTYAVPMIIGEIRRYIRDNNSIRVSRSLRDTAYHALKARESLAYELGREPTVDEIAQKMQLAKEDVVFALDSIQEPMSLFEPIYNDGGDPIYLMDQLGDQKNTDRRWLENILVEQAVKHLSEREQTIIDLRFFQGKTQMEVAEEIGISQAQVSRLEKGALTQMKKYV